MASTFIYGAVKGTAHKWLDIQRLCASLRPNETLIRVRYFTSIVLGMKARERQGEFLRAIRTLPLVSVHQGAFSTKNVGCEVDLCAHVGHKRYDVVVEKRTDVNIGVHMLDDAHRDRCDVLAKWAD